MIRKFYDIEIDLVPFGGQPPQRPSMEWQLCPKCNGQGMVSKPPYIAGDVHQWSSTEVSFPCNVCNGAKILATHTSNETGESNESLREALENLLQLKDWKDKYGKDEHYEKHQPLAWEAARKALNEYLKQVTNNSK